MDRSFFTGILASGKNINIRGGTNMASLDELAKIPGVVAAGEFNDDGKLVSYRGQIKSDVAHSAAQFCATVNMMFKTLGGAFQGMSGMEWTPSQGWAYAGGKYSVCVGGNKGVFIETAKADYNQLFTALIGQRPK
jgi:roadblock/LC7 domain-containing protein